MEIKVKIDDLDQLQDVAVDSTGRVSLGSNFADERVLLAVLPQLILEVEGEENIKALDTDSRGRANVGTEHADEDLFVAVIDTKDTDGNSVEISDLPDADSKEDRDEGVGEDG